MKRLLTLLFLLFPLLTEAQERDFRLMSFNIERGDLSVSKGWGWDVRRPAALAMLENDRPDVLGVQECNSQQRDDILARMQYKCIGLSVDGLSGEHATSANYIFYDSGKFDLLDDGVFWYAFEPDSAGMYTWIAKKPRNAVWGRFRHKDSGREFIYINNHLQNGGDAVLNRAMSITLLLHKMREINPDALPLIYSGDLNSKGTEYYYAPLRQEMRHAVDVCPLTDRDVTLGSYKRKTGTDGQIDHIWFSGALEGLRFAVDRDAYAGLDYVSDHFPVYCDFRFTDEAPARGGEPCWFDIVPRESDFTVKAGTWNLFSTVERGERGAPSWNEVKAGVAATIASLDVDLLGLQELTEPMLRDLPRLLKAECGGRYKLWAAFSDPSPDNPGREAVGLLYNAERFVLSGQRQSWIRAGDTDTPAKPWGDSFRSVLTAVFKDKATGKRFFVLTGKFCKGANPVKFEGFVIKTIEQEQNKDALPSILLADMNTAPRGNVFISLLNYWTDSYALLYPFRDRYFSTRISQTEYGPNTPQDWNIKYDIVGISRYVENKIKVTSHTVHREIRMRAPVPSDHYPVTATFVFAE